MNFGKTALQVLETVAPTLALAVGGPFGPIAAAAIHAALGTTDTASAEAALSSATPEQLLALKKADQEFELQLQQIGVAKDKLAYDDTANARNREIQLRDKLPAILAILVTFGFFGVLAFMCWHGTPTSGGEPFLVMLGSLGTAWTGIVGYYFGSSAGSAAKTDAINKIAAAKP